MYPTCSFPRLPGRRGLTALLALLLAGALGLSGCDTARVASLKELSAGMREYHKEAYPKARTHFQAAVDADPRNELAHYYLGMVLFHQLRELPGAEEHLRKAVELKPQEPDYSYQLAIVLLTRSNADAEAEALLRKTISLQANQAEAHYRLAAILQKREQFDDAVRMYTRAIELKPRFIRPYVELATLYEEYEHLPQALQVMDNATRNCPKEAEGHNEYGRMLAKDKQLPKAIEEYNQALQLKPDYEGALFNLGVAYLENQEKDKAVRLLRRFMAKARRAEDPFRVDLAEMTVAMIEFEVQQANPPQPQPGAKP